MTIRNPEHKSAAHAALDAIEAAERKSHYDKPMAAAGLTSFRYPTPGGGYIMIGAKDNADALNEANRSLTNKGATLDKLERWNGKRYVTVLQLRIEGDAVYAGDELLGEFPPGERQFVPSKLLLNRPHDHKQVDEFVRGLTFAVSLSKGRRK